ncbi:MAG: imidazole glycerol phosphate synthase subunit HisH [Betaproteobacteria bacterium]|nr:imidazole glycerol phosphate synthase subunit HisH [Betaproteobacteria bacterium]
MRVAIVDYQAGNLRNVQKAVERLDRKAGIVQRGEALANADAIILPGVGAFGHGMENLVRAGFVEALRREVLEKGKPLLGICLGMQLLGTRGFEDGEMPGLGLLPMFVPRFDLTRCKVRLPHNGWNSVAIEPASVLFEGVPQGADFFFVHSYHVVCDDESMVAARCDYGYPFAAALEHENIFATQFHPEKSQRHGLRVLKNFLAHCEARR